MPQVDPSSGKARAQDGSRSSTPYPPPSQRNPAALDEQDARDFDSLSRYSKDYWAASAKAKDAKLPQLDKMFAASKRDEAAKYAMEIIRARDQRVNAGPAPKAPQPPRTPISPAGQAERELSPEKETPPTFAPEVAALVQNAQASTRIKATALAAALAPSSSMITLNIPRLEQYIASDGTFAAADIVPLATLLDEYIHGIATGQRLTARLSKAIPGMQLSLSASSHEIWNLHLASRS